MPATRNQQQANKRKLCNANGTCSSWSLTDKLPKCSCLFDSSVSRFHRGDKAGRGQRPWCMRRGQRWGRGRRGQPRAVPLGRPASTAAVVGHGQRWGGVAADHQRVDTLRPWGVPHAFPRGVQGRQRDKKLGFANNYKALGRGVCTYGLGMGWRCMQIPKWTEVGREEWNWGLHM